MSCRYTYFDNMFDECIDRVRIKWRLVNKKFIFVVYKLVNLGFVDLLIWEFILSVNGFSYFFSLLILLRFILILEIILKSFFVFSVCI